MNLFNELSRESLRLNTLSDKTLAQVTAQLQRFTYRYYGIVDARQFVTQILQPDQDGLVDIYRISGKLAGFTRTYRQYANTPAYDGMVFSSSSWHLPSKALMALMARRVILRALRYKLANPHEPIFYIDIVNSAQRFQYLKQVNPQCIALLEKTTNHQAAVLRTQLCRHNGWTQDSKNPLIIVQNGQLSQPKNSVSALDSEYHHVNPGAEKGDWLMVCVPTDIAIIGQCLKRLMHPSFALG